MALFSLYTLLCLVPGLEELHIRNTRGWGKTASDKYAKEVFNNPDYKKNGTGPGATIFVGTGKKLFHQELRSHTESCDSTDPRIGYDQGMRRLSRPGLPSTDNFFLQNDDDQEAGFKCSLCFGEHLNNGT